MNLDYSSSTYFIVTLLVVAIATTLYSLIVMRVRPETKLDKADIKDIYKGVIIFVLAGVLLGLSSMAFSSSPNRLHWFQYAEAYIGLDSTYGVSPFCEDRGINSRLTSNGGLRLNILESNDRLFSLNGKYTHNSCGFSPDKPTYDAVGLELVYRFFTR